MPSKLVSFVTVLAAEGLVSLLAANLAPCDALRMINLDAPEWALQGDSIQLGCFFTLANVSESQEEKSKLAASGESTNTTEMELLYAIKWYKDGHEFFRYLAQDWPRRQALPRPGLWVDVERSDNHTLVLQNVTLETSGLFKCEVSTDLPSFETKSIERELVVYAPPAAGPSIESPLGKDSRVYVGNHIVLSCSAPESKPPATLDWIINDSLNLSTPETLVGLEISVKRRRHICLTTHQPGHCNLHELKLDKLASRLVIRAGNGSERDFPAEKLNQLSVMSDSQLNLTADDKLLQALGLLAATKPINPQENLTSKPSLLKGKSDSQHFTGQLYITSKRKWVGKSHGRSDSFSLRIKCIARVLHLNLSDEIKLTLVNKTVDADKARANPPRVLRRLGQTLLEGSGHNSVPSVSMLSSAIVYFLPVVLAILMSDVKLKLK